MRRKRPDGRRAAAAVLAVGVALALAGVVSPDAASAGTPRKALPRAPEEEMVSTRDGWRLPLLHYPPSPSAGEPFPTPVVLVHGTGVNRMNWMATPRHDLASYLARRGFDVYVVELRGDHTSTPPTAGELSRGAWDFDSHVRQDLPAHLERIRQRTGKRAVAWIGHSLGGILGYAYVADVDPEGVAALVTLGSPTRLSPLGSSQARARKLAGLVPRSGRLMVPGLARLVMPLFSRSSDRMAHVIVNPGNADPEAMRGMTRAGLEAVASGLLRQYLTWTRVGEICDRHGRERYRGGLSAFRSPALVVAGRADNVVPPWQVRAAYHDLGSGDKEWLVLGRGWGFSADYGHGDMMVGTQVPAEVFPRLATWLEEHAGGGGFVEGP